MALLHFSDILINAGLDPAKVQLIRHAKNDKDFRACYEKNMVKEYTGEQKKDFNKGYDYWAVFISGKGTEARFYKLYRVGAVVPRCLEVMPKDYPCPQAFETPGDYYELEYADILKEFENRLIIKWGDATRVWHQKGTTEKEIVAIQTSHNEEFVGYENVVLPYEKLKEVVENDVDYKLWHTALSNVKAVYLILDVKNGQQYVGSAYGNRGLLERWECYVDTFHGNNKLMREVICDYPDRYQFFQFSILQIFSMSTPDDIIINAENLWKRKLGTKEYGMNAN